MKAQPYKKEETPDGQISFIRCAPEDATHLDFRMPGPSGRLLLPVIIKGERRSTPCWTWNGSIEAPTLKPSIRTEGHDFLCHSFMTDGKVQFLSDSTHEFAGQTVEMPDLDD